MLRAAVAVAASVSGSGGGLVRTTGRRIANKNVKFFVRALGWSRAAAAGSSFCVSVSIGLNMNSRLFSSAPQGLARLPRAAAYYAKVSAALSKTNSASEGNSEESNLQSENDEHDSLLIEAMPRGVTLTFYKGYLDLLDALETSAAAVAAKKREHGKNNSKEYVGAVDATLLRRLAANATSAPDLSLFRDILARWRRHKKPLLELDATDMRTIIAKFLSVGESETAANDVLLNVALNTFKYGIYLDTASIHVLLSRFAEDVVNNASANSLDNLYKSFALLLYSNVPPSAKSYLHLIYAGAYCDDLLNSDAWQYALTSFAEAEWLFFGPKNLPSDVYNAILAGYIKRSDFSSASELISRVSASTSLDSRLLVETHLMNGNLASAVDFLAVPSTSESKKLPFVDRWTPISEIHDALLAELKEKDTALYIKAKALIE
ncbi:hypothetical protein HK100_006027 [Physocladia obscura]|uniref:Uncharacterized protein n=1 Tax=Physocladia obscura TaxID=109957 RepID=A0AAD5TAF8_9FUNG|nr:hypothetical protein HK100_006027 [Physocladia obscura]